MRQTRYHPIIGPLSKRARFSLDIVDLCNGSNSAVSTQNAPNPRSPSVNYVAATPTDMATSVAILPALGAVGL